MKILVAILTRNRPIALTALIYALDALSKFPERITYAVRADEDDPRTYQAAMYCARSGLPVVYGHGERYPGLGQIWNRTVSETAKDVEPDLIYYCSDGYIPISQSWDVVLESYFNDATRAACSWTELNDPINPTHVVITRKWYEALAGKVCWELAPYWWSGDAWLNEIHAFAFGKPIPILDRLVLAGKRGHTSGMRDLEFWLRVFAKTRLERYACAVKLAQAYNVELPDPEPIIEILTKSDTNKLSKVSEFEQAFGAEPITKPPSERYLIAKALAEELLNAT